MIRPVLFSLLVLAGSLSGCASFAPHTRVLVHAPDRIEYGVGWRDLIHGPSLSFVPGPGILGLSVVPLDGDAFAVRAWDDQGGDYAIRVVPRDRGGFDLPEWRHGYSDRLNGWRFVIARGGKCMFLEGLDHTRWKRGERGWWSDPTTWENPCLAAAWEPSRATN